jgi:hypothetical protein
VSDDQVNNVDPSELDTVVPNPPHTAAAAQPGKWQMPEPVFQQSSGYLPQGFEKRFPQAVPATTRLDPEAVGLDTAGTVEAADEPPEVPFDANITMVGAPMPMDLPKTPAKPPTSVAPIEPPQPEFPDTLTNFEEEPQAQSVPESATPAAKQGRSGLRTLMLVIGILAILAFVAVFLAAVYFLYLLPSPEAGSF